MVSMWSLLNYPLNWALPFICLSSLCIYLCPALSPAPTLLFDASAFMMGNNKNSKVCEPTGKLEFIPLTETVNVQWTAPEWIRRRKGPHPCDRVAQHAWQLRPGCTPAPDPGPLIRESFVFLSATTIVIRSQIATLMTLKHLLNSVPSINVALVHMKTRRSLQLGNSLHWTECMTVTSMSSQQRRRWRWNAQGPPGAAGSFGQGCGRFSWHSWSSPTSLALALSHQPTEKAA